MDFQIDYKQEDNIEKEKKLISLVRAVDLNYIPREGYRALAAVELNLQCEWAVSNQRLQITREMNQKIPITLINIPNFPIQNELDFAENLNIFDTETIEVIENIKKGGIRSIKDILKYIVNNP